MAYNGIIKKIYQESFMKKIFTGLIAVLVIAQLLIFSACGGYDPQPMYDKTFEYTGGAMTIPWDEVHNRSYSDETDLKMKKRAVLEKYFSSVDWEATQASFNIADYPSITITEQAKQSVDDFIAFMDNAVKSIYSDLQGFKFKIGSEADEVDVTIIYPNGKSQTVKTKNGGSYDPQSFRGIMFTKEGDNGTEISLSLSRTGNSGVAFNVTLSDAFSYEQTGKMFLNTALSYCLKGENDISLMDIDVYAAYTES